MIVPSIACAQTNIGLEALYLTGTHYELEGSIPEQFVAPLLRFSAGGNRVEFEAEGVPAYGAASSGSSPVMGSSTTSLGFGDAVVRAAIDRNSRTWLGYGSVVISQHTMYTGLNDPYTYVSESSRLTGPRYQLQVHVPIRASRVIVGFTAMPVLRGTAYFEGCAACYYSSAKLNEQGAMTDAEATFESTRGRSTLSIGLRFINYSAVFTPYHVLADRNVGGGLSLRYSYAFGR